MDIALLLELCILATAALFAGIAIYKSRKSGVKEIPWDKLRPMLSETFIAIKEVQALRQLGYQALEDYAVLLIRQQVTKASFLTETEKLLISDDLIRNLVGPRLRELHESAGE